MKINTKLRSPNYYKKQVLRKKLVETRLSLFESQYDQFIQPKKNLKKTLGLLKVKKIPGNQQILNFKTPQGKNISLKSHQRMKRRSLQKNSEVKSLKKISQLDFRQRNLNFGQCSRTQRGQDTMRKRRVTQGSVPHEEQSNQRLFNIRKRIIFTNNTVNKDVKQSPKSTKYVNYQKFLAIFSSQQNIIRKMQIKDVLGIGANAEVRQAEFQGNKYAIKIYEKQKICSKYKKQRIYSEIKILTSISKHPNIISLLHAYENKNQIHIIFQHIDKAVTLKDYFAQKDYNLPQNQIKKIFLKLIKGVNYLHSNKIAHRDLKPANVVLAFDQDGEMIIKIIDFGVATNQIKSDFLCGTPNFIAPELIFRNKQINLYGCDVWALGVILFYLCQARYPFVGNNQIQLYANIKKGSFHFSVNQSPQIKDIIQKMLVLDPAKRISTQQLLRHYWFYH